MSSNLTLSAKLARMAELGIRSGFRSHTIIGSSPITGTNVLFSLFTKSPKIFLREIFWYIGKIVVYLTYKVDWETKQEIVE